MRQILFRGKTYRGDWVYGSLIVAQEYLIENHTGQRLVNPETVGQYTGCVDADGKKIFEGDIIRNDGNVVEFCNGGFFVNGDSPLALWQHERVVGNIHDRKMCV